MVALAREALLGFLRPATLALWWRGAESRVFPRAVSVLCRGKDTTESISRGQGEQTSDLSLDAVPEGTGGRPWLSILEWWCWHRGLT